MKSTKAIVRILAVIMTVAMCASFLGCVSSYRANPVVAKVGGVKLDLSQYLSLYNNTDTNSNIYYMYLQYGLIDAEQYAKYILEDLVNYGVQLDQVNVQKITLDEEEEAKLQKDIDDQIAQSLASNYSSKIDSSITDETEKYNAAMELLKADLKKNGSTFEQYRKDIETTLRNSALITKLHDVTVKDVATTVDDVKKYFEDNATAGDVSSFNSAFTKFITKTSDSLPLCIPHPERAVEDDPETADKDESKAADPYGEIFSVQHLLMKFATAAGKDVTDLAEYAEQDKSLSVKMKAFEETLSSLTTAQFLEKCYDKDYCDDPGMLEKAYQYFGYMMQKSIIDSYYDGFGYAAMKLKFGESWEPEKTEDESSETEEKTYSVNYYTLADGAKVAKVFTTSGAHYIIVNPNDCFGMYNEEGYLMVPVYENDSVVTDGEGIVTLNGHMTQAQFDAEAKILENVAAVSSTTTEEKEETEEQETVTPKALYDFCSDAKLSAMQSDVFTEAFKQWKDNTKIVTKNNLLKAFYKG